MCQFHLYFDPDGAYAPVLQKLKLLLEEILRKWKVKYETVEAGTLSNRDLERLQSSIRTIPPQVRGRIVSSGNHLLPLSRKKRLNLKNTPVILLSKDDYPVDVFPHLLGTRYCSSEDALLRILKMGPEEYIESRGILEDPLVKIISDYPGSLGKNTIFLERDTETEAGVIDLLLEDNHGNPVVVEIETEAGDSSIAQVCRLAASYARSKNISLQKVRKIVVCLGYEGHLSTTCEGAGVELYEMRFVRIK